jgi:single-strand DNA-binding protein
MADGLNKVMLFGNLGADPELRMSAGGQPILRLRLATAESYLDKNNVRQERTEWHSVTLFGKRAEALGKILQKGSSLFIEGAIRTSTYEKDGEKRYRTEIVANNVILGGRGRGGDSRDDAPAPAQSRAPQGRAPAKAAPQDDYERNYSDDEIPF